MNFIYKSRKHRFEKLGHDLLSPLNLQLYANSLHAERTDLNSCWGFIDGTLQPICRPQKMQRE